MAKPIKPGTDNQKPGTYVEVGPRGGRVSNPRVVRIGSGAKLSASDIDCVRSRIKCSPHALIGACRRQYFNLSIHLSLYLL